VSEGETDCMNVVLGKMGKVKKGAHCDVDGCNEIAVRSLSKSSAGGSLSDAGLEVKSPGNRFFICDKHYKRLKKKLKKTRKVESLRFEKPF
jgi:hypothetical protein